MSELYLSEYGIEREFDDVLFNAWSIINRVERRIASVRVITMPSFKTTLPYVGDVRSP